MAAARSNPLALAVLLCLLERPMHPYEIAETLRSRAKEESVRLNYGSLYAVVESLQKRGLVRARETLRHGRRPERTVYELTEQGGREATDWLSDLLSVPVKEFPQFMAALSFLPALPPEEVGEALRQRATALEMRLVHLRGLLQAVAATGFPRLFSIENEYEVAMTEAELEFVRRLSKEIDSGAFDGLELWRQFHADEGQREEILASITPPFGREPPTGS